MDADSISKGRTVYKLVGINPPHHDKNNSFSVSEDGKIRTARVFDREKQSHYMLTLYAEDHTLFLSNRMWTTFCVVVNIKDANDHRPRYVIITSLTSTLSEDRTCLGDATIYLMFVLVLILGPIQGC